MNLQKINKKTEKVIKGLFDNATINELVQTILIGLEDIKDRKALKDYLIYFAEKIKIEGKK